MYKKLSDDADQQEELGVDLTAIIISVCLAITHALLESLVILMESKSANLHFTEYMIICFTGRFGWVPYVENISMQRLQKEFDFDSLKYPVCGGSMVYKQEYFFSDETLKTLTK